MHSHPWMASNPIKNVAEEAVLLGSLVLNAWCFHYFPVPIHLSNNLPKPVATCVLVSDQTFHAAEFVLPMVIRCPLIKEAMSSATLLSSAPLSCCASEAQNH